ncbi:uncharacterized protein MCAP_0864 [Drosophila kikkawai]|uniref:Uncharacterized protein MCAP_0864 n=1 Tax=Drosophila kikkawai TaxID=30033 RepID=A0A6P4IBQ4_DROKI|nr:paramyosin [Drosophila kikkawai]XP_017025620.1 paramyosin [Drosophila kikkawai]KAH8307991.1 hypothetical protein KR059_004012 [Drosophila kikkawai]
MPETKMASKENRGCDCRCRNSPGSKTGASGDQQGTIGFPVRDSSTSQSSPRSDASMKVFTSFMLNAWRQRREEVRDLQQVVQGLQNSSMKTKNELHVLNTVMRVEEKRNSELQMQLNQSHMSINKVRTSCESLTSSVQSLTAEKNELCKELNKSRQELKDLEEISGQTKKELFGALSEQSNLQKQLSEEQRSRHQLQLENEELLKKVIMADCKKAQYKKAKEQAQQELAERDARIQTLRAALEEKQRHGSEQTAELERIKAQITEICHRNTSSNFLSLCSASISRLSVTPRTSQEVSSFQRLPLWQKLHRFSTNLIYLLLSYFRPGVPLSRSRHLLLG